MFTNCISTHNNLEYLKLGVKSIRENSHFDFPLYIYAEGCTDGTNAWLESQDQTDYFRYWIKAEKWDENYWGIGGGMNFLAEQVQTDYINFLHSDMYVSPGWDKPLYELLVKKGRGHVASSYRCEPNVFGGTSRYGTVIEDKDKFGEYHHNFRDYSFSQWAEAFTKLNKEVDIPLGQGVSFMIHKRDWDEVGGNDPRFAPASYEDVDLFIRMQQKGYRFHTLGASMIYHFGARGSHFPDDDLSKSSDRQKQSEEKNARIFKEKWGEHFIRNKYGMFVLPSW